MHPLEKKSVVNNKNVPMIFMVVFDVA